MKAKVHKLKIKEEIELEFNEQTLRIKFSVENPNTVFDSEDMKILQARNKEEAIEVISKKLVLLTMTKQTIQFDNLQGLSDHEKVKMTGNPMKLGLLASTDTFLEMEINKWTIRLLRLLDPEEYEDLVARGEAIYKGTNEALNNEQRYNVSIRARRSFSGLDYVKVSVDDIQKDLNYRSYEDFTKHWDIKNENFKLFAD